MKCLKCYPLKTKEAPFECKAICALAKTIENPVLEIWMWMMKCLHLIIHEVFSNFSRGIWLAGAYFVLLIVALIHRTGKVVETVFCQSLRVRPSLSNPTSYWPNWNPNHSTRGQAKLLVLIACQKIILGVTEASHGRCPKSSQHLKTYLVFNFKIPFKIFKIIM